MSDHIRNLLQSALRKAPEVLVNTALSHVERELERVQIRADDRRRAGPLLRRLAESHAKSDWVTLPSVIGRGRFLAAAHRFVAEKPDEWAIVGLGTASQRSYVRDVFVRRGGVAAVSIPVSVQAQIKGHLEDVADAEIIHVHNHPPGVPRDIKNLLLGRAPITSDADRVVARAHVDVARAAAMKTLTRRTVRFYVVENGDVHRYWLPSGGPLRDAANALFGRFVER